MQTDAGADSGLKAEANSVIHLSREICQRDDGMWSIGFGDDSPGPFPSREFALSVAGYSQPVPTPPFRRIKFKEARSAGTP